ncbi:MAG: VCBS repeat-containing protein, partial [Acidobacteriota bacterium]
MSGGPPARRPVAPVLALGTALGIGAWLAGCAQPAPAPEDPGTEEDTPAIHLVDMARDAGLDFVHDPGLTGSFHIAELMGAGAALFDSDGDGDLDVYLVQGGPLGEGDSAAPEDRLFRNDTSGGGPIRFTDVSAEAGDLPADYGMGVAAGDVDDDGDVDLYVTAYGSNRLLLNRGGGVFDDRTDAAGVAETRWSVPAVFADFDRDGRLDLFVGNYLGDEASHAQRRCNSPDGRRDYCSAALWPGLTDRLFRNLGPGDDGAPRFEDVTESAGITEPGRALGAVALDADGDGWLDLYVANDGDPNHLWRNLGAGHGGLRFEETALLAGVAVNAKGQAEASMGIAVGDPDGDGDDDLLLTHLVVETHTFYRRRGPLLFDDHTAAVGLEAPSRLHTGFGVSYFDPDGDGDLDLYVANGAVQNRLDLAAAGDPFPFHERDQVLRNLGDGGALRLVDVSPEAGDALAVSDVGRGVALGDVDGDGDLDVLVTANGGSARLLESRGSEGRRFIGVRAVVGSREALGTRVELRFEDGSSRWRTADTGGSYG